MTITRVSRRIDAPIARVFSTVADIRNFSEVVPEITDVEFLTEQKVGVGTRFRETRTMNNKPAVTELEVTEYIVDERIRIVSDTHGTVWDTVFTVAEVDGQVELVLVMEARAYQLLPKLMNPLIKGMVAKAIGRDLDAVKAWCEAVE